MTEDNTMTEREIIQNMLDPTTAFMYNAISSANTPLFELLSPTQEDDKLSSVIKATIMNNTSTQSTLSQLLLWFTRFAARMGTSFSCSPPYHLQSNGQAERTVRIVKYLCRKTSNLSLDELLFSYRATPLVSGNTLAELLLSRMIRTRQDGYLP
ncbi:unnamed protein product [Lepeophtheirus salmonis]|uniref:(salmon louse) hypothetical protein n=1 Tax=Lepeophtheirus salmonis TaxID=72036 RepID=A0A817FAB8_LEPSM|nr:unnamed protein product [Lepeophtheirus salmonis]CAG9476382.1 unnamed protein product [Lepeophtheirus salmonis]